jgi:mono/diheme cytochrome c family protein
MHKSSIRGLSLLFTLAVFAISTSLCLANGQDDHGQKHEKSAHMEAMYALKEKVPEDYRIMERTPVLPDQDSLQRGGDLFRQQCALCHGQAGQGDGPAAKGLNPKPANFLDREHSSIYGPGEKFWIIGNGSGETGMPAFPHLGLVDRWHLVNHIYELQGAEVKDDGHKHHH